MMAKKTAGSGRSMFGGDPVKKALEDMPRVPAPPGFTQKVLMIVLGRLPEPREEEARSGRRSGLIWIGAAALGISLAVGLAIARRIAGHTSDVDNGSLTALRPA